MSKNKEPMLCPCCGNAGTIWLDTDTCDDFRCSANECDFDSAKVHAMISSCDILLQIARAAYKARFEPSPMSESIKLTR